MGKTEQTIIWIVTYIPLFLFILLKFNLNTDYLPVSNFLNDSLRKFYFENYALFELAFVLMILIFSYFMYKKTASFFLEGYETNVKDGKEGSNYYIKKINNLTGNDYNFLILTIILPLFSISHDFLVDLLVTFIIVILIICIQVKTNSVYTSPIFLLSGRKLYRCTIYPEEGIISRTEENIYSFSGKEVIIIANPKNITLNGSVRGQKIAGNLYYITNI